MGSFVTKVQSESVTKEVCTTIQTAMTDPKAAIEYADAVGMDSNNRRVLMAFAEGGKDAGFKALFTAPDGKRTLSYAESRALYG